MHKAFEILMYMQEEREFILEALQENDSIASMTSMETEFDEMAELVSDRFELLSRLDQVEKMIEQVQFLIGEDDRHE